MRYSCTIKLEAIAVYSIARQQALVFDIDHPPCNRQSSHITLFIASSSHEDPARGKQAVYKFSAEAYAAERVCHTCSSQQPSIVNALALLHMIECQQQGKLGLQGWGTAVHNSSCKQFCDEVASADFASTQAVSSKHRKVRGH